MMSVIEPLLAADVPRWIWAALLMAAFVAVTLVTMLLARYAVRHPPSPAAEDKRRTRERRR